MVNLCPYICNNKTEYGYCKTGACVNPAHRTFSFTSYDPIEIARQYAPKFDKPVVDMVEVVRCKDCKYFKTYPPTEDQDYTIYDCERLNYCTDNAVGNKPDDFCSRAERKDEVTE